MFDFRPGAGGVEVYPGCYSGMNDNCGWQILGGSADVDPLSPGVVPVLPTVTQAFETKAVYVFGINPLSPSQNLRFTIGAITTGGRPQYANNRAIPNGGNGEILSDAFNRSDEPVIVSNWSVLTTAGLGAPLNFSVFNLNAVPLRVFVCLWGNAMINGFITEWKNAESEGYTIGLKNEGPNDAEPFWHTVWMEGEPPKGECSGKQPTISKCKRKKKRKKKKLFGIL